MRPVRAHEAVVLSAECAMGRWTTPPPGKSVVSRDVKAIRFHQHGGPEVLRYEDAPTPEPGPGEVLVALRAAALNHLDLFTRNGGVPTVPGWLRRPGPARPAIQPAPASSSTRGCATAPATTAPVASTACATGGRS